LPQIKKLCHIFSPIFSEIAGLSAANQRSLIGVGIRCWLCCKR